MFENLSVIIELMYSIRGEENVNGTHRGVQQYKIHVKSTIKISMQDIAIRGHTVS